jgi:hypothetical protein
VSQDINTLWVKNWRNIAIKKESLQKLLRKARAHAGLSSELWWWWSSGNRPNISEVCTAFIIALIMEAVSTTELPVYLHETTWCYIPESCNSHLKTCFLKCVYKKQAGTLNSFYNVSFSFKLKELWSLQHVTSMSIALFPFYSESLNLCSHEIWQSPSESPCIYKSITRGLKWQSFIACCFYMNPA